MNNRATTLPSSPPLFLCFSRALLHPSTASSSGVALLLCLSVVQSSAASCGVVWQWPATLNVMYPACTWPIAWLTPNQSLQTNSHTDDKSTFALQMLPFPFLEHPRLMTSAKTQSRLQAFLARLSGCKAYQALTRSPTNSTALQLQLVQRAAQLMVQLTVQLFFLLALYSHCNRRQRDGNC